MITADESRPWASDVWPGGISHFHRTRTQTRSLVAYVFRELACFLYAGFRELTSAGSL